MLTETQSNRLHIPTREQFHTTYSGEIIEEDFGNHPNDTAKKIFKAQSIDKDCMRFAASRERRNSKISSLY